MITDYNSISEEYSKFLETPLRKAVQDYNFTKWINKIISERNLSIKDSSVLDLACGEGRYSRALKSLGFDNVFGVDKSKKLIEIAKAKESQNIQGIEYFSCDVLDLGKLQIGKFDIIIAWFLLHYATSKDDLNLMLKEISKKMKKGSVFIAYQSNPRGAQSRDYKKYGEIKKVIGKEIEGADVSVTLFDGKDKISFVRKFWSSKTYESAFRSAGIRFGGWFDADISPEAIQKKGESFWKDYFDNPSHTVIIGFKD